MTTARDLIKQSLRKIGAYAIGEEPSADEGNDGLQTLNAMIDSWGNENLFINAKTLDSIPLIAGQSPVTVGPTGTFVTTRPITIDSSSYILFNGVSYQLGKLTDAEYQAVGLKTQTGIPSTFWPLMNIPNAQVTFWPVPSQAMTFQMWSTKQLQSFATLDTILVLQPGAERAITNSLAEELAPEYEVQVPPSVSLAAMRGRKNLKRTNTQVPRLSMPYGIPAGNNYFDGRYW